MVDVFYFTPNIWILADRNAKNIKKNEEKQSSNDLSGNGESYIDIRVNGQCS